MNRQKKYILIFLAVIFLAGSCRKVELPPPVTEDPIFSLGLSWAGGGGLDLAAGENRYYLHTAFEADSLNVFEFSGRFAQLDCLDQCEPSFAIYFRDAQVTQGNDPDAPDFLQNQQAYDFRGPVTPASDTLVSYVVNFQSTSQTGGTQPMHFWTFDDSLTLVGQVVEIIRSNTMPFKACLELDANGTGCYAKQCQLVRMDSFPGFSALVEFDSNMLALKALPIGGIPPYSYSWDNGITSSTNQAIQPGGTYCVTITDNASTEAVSCVQASLNPVGNLSCVANFAYQSSEEIEIIPIPGDSLQFKTVILEYVEDGVVFRSDRAAQPSGSFFLIDSIEPYEPNENNQLTLRIKARFSGMLWAENGNARQVEEASVVFGIAIAM